MATQQEHIYQVKVTLTGSSPPIWRRLLVPGQIPLAQLHDVLQIAMGWTDSQMHQFEKNGRLLRLPLHDWDFEPVLDERSTRLNKLLRREKDWLRYEYDFGDGWEHRVTLEKVLPYDPGVATPICIKAKGACPPEDIGGLWGYYAAREAWKDPAHPDHAEVREMFDRDTLFPGDPDVAEVNGLLSSCFSQAA